VRSHATALFKGAGILLSTPHRVRSRSGSPAERPACRSPNPSWGAVSRGPSARCPGSRSPNPSWGAVRPSAGGTAFRRISPNPSWGAVSLAWSAYALMSLPSQPLMGCDHALGQLRVRPGHPLPTPYGYGQLGDQGADAQPVNLPTPPGVRSPPGNILGSVDLAHFQPLMGCGHAQVAAHGGGRGVLPTPHRVRSPSCSIWTPWWLISQPLMGCGQPDAGQHAERREALPIPHGARSDRLRVLWPGGAELPTPHGVRSAARSCRAGAAC